MDFAVDAAVLAETLRKASVALPRGSSEADYKLAELDVRRKKLTITCTDGEFMCTTACPCKNDGAETFLVDTRKLLAVAERSVGDMHCSLAGKFTVMGTHRATIRCQSGSHTRRATENMSCKFTLSEEQIDHLFVVRSVTDYATAGAGSIGVIAKNERALLSAFDLAFFAFLEVPCIGEVETKIPGAYMKKAVSVGATVVEIFANENIKMSGDNATCLMPSEAGVLVDFMKYTQYKPVTKIVLDKTLMPSLELASEFGSVTVKGKLVQAGIVSYKNKGITIHAAGDGEVDTQEISVVGEGIPVEIKLSLKCLKGALNSLTECTASFNEYPDSPFYWLLMERDGMYYIVWPMK